MNVVLHALCSGFAASEHLLKLFRRDGAAEVIALDFVAVAFFVLTVKPDAPALMPVLFNIRQIDVSSVRPKNTPTSESAALSFFFRLRSFTVTKSDDIAEIIRWALICSAFSCSLPGIPFG